METGFLVLDGTENAKEVDQHHTVGKLRPIVEAVDLMTVLGDARKWKDVVEIHAEIGVDVVDEGLDILFRGLVEGNDSESRATAAKGLEDRLVVFNRLPAVARGGNDDVGTSREETLDNFDTDRAFADSSKERVFVLEGSTRGGDFVEDVEIYTGQIAAGLPVRADLVLQMQERNLIGGDGGDRSDASDLWAEEGR